MISSAWFACRLAVKLLAFVVDEFNSYFQSHLSIALQPLSDGRLNALLAQDEGEQSVICVAVR